MPSDRKTQPTRMRMSRIAFAARFAQITSVFEVMELSPRAGCELIRTSSHIVEQSHEAKVHVKLLAAVKQRQARIVGDEIDFRPQARQCQSGIGGGKRQGRSDASPQDKARCWFALE